VRQVSVQKPQRSTLTTDSSLSVGGRSVGSPHPPSEPRTFPPFALALALALGIVLGLLLAAAISAFVDGSGTGKPRVSASTTPKASTSQQQSDLSTTQRQDQIQSDSVPEDRDVRILGCGTDADGYASAEVLISNGSAKRSTYFVRVIFTSAASGRTISDDVASVKRLPPGKSAPPQVVNAIDRAPGQTVLCRLGSVTRY
jgi:hypothetical protein